MSILVHGESGGRVSEGYTHRLHVCTIFDSQCGECVSQVVQTSVLKAKASHYTLEVFENAIRIVLSVNDDVKTR